MPDAGRVIAGTARSVRLEAPGEGTRPLADRVKQTLFAILEPDLRGATFLDLFAGSGAAGIEALSRGAAHATFVERDAGAIRTIKANLQRTGLAERATVTRGEVLAWLRDSARAAEPRREIVLLDPPYEETAALAAALDALGAVAHPERPCRREALLARRPAGPRRAASIGARAPLRRDDAHVLPTCRRHHGGRMSVAVYPGSFDPITNGHLDIIGRAANVFDRVIVAVLANPRKSPLLPVEERMRVIRESIAEDGAPADRIEVASFDGLTVDFCHAHDATAIVRGLRAISDFETEMQLAHNNRVLAPEIDTVFFMTSIANGYVSSSLVKEIASFGGDVSAMLPKPAAAALAAALGPR